MFIYATPPHYVGLYSEVDNMQKETLHLKYSEEEILKELGGSALTKGELEKRLKGRVASQTITERLPELQRLKFIKMIRENGEWKYMRLR